MADINFNGVPIASAVSNSDYLHITNASNEHKRVSVEKLVNLAKQGALDSTNAAMLDKLTDGCFIFYHRAIEGNGDNYPVACRASQWTAKQSAGEIANGVLLIQGGKHLVIAPTGSAKIHWGSVTTAVNQVSSDRVWALNDFDGKTKTAAIVANASYSGDGADYAPGFCSAYSRTNKNGRGLTAGRWWLPSMGELAMIWANKQKINACLQLITGAQTLPEDAHWSSSEPSATNAWYLNLSNGDLFASSKVSPSSYVRPVSAFLN